MGLRADRIALIGLRCAGKTTVGRALAAALRRPFADIDELVLADTGRSAGDWIRGPGLGAFRDVEALALDRALTIPRVVCATGGGSATIASNRERLRLAATVIYLRADPFTLAQRIARDLGDRPALEGTDPWAEIHAQFADRDAIYRQTCDVIVDANGSLESVVARTIRLASGS